MLQPWMSADVTKARDLITSPPLALAIQTIKTHTVADGPTPPQENLDGRHHHASETETHSTVVVRVLP